jgi:putative ABC transport system permease protein
MRRRIPASAVLTLAVGIAVNAAVFSVLKTVLLDPLPYRDASRIAAIYQQNPERNLRQQLVTEPDYFDWTRAAGSAFESLAAWNFQFFNLSGADEPERVEGLKVTSRFFEVLGVQPALGRTFLPEEERAGRDRVVILTDNLWRRRFAADPAIVGRPILIEDEPYVVTGVLPPDYRVFRVLNRELDLYVPLALDPARAGRRDHLLFVYGRLRPGVGTAQAQTVLDGIPADPGWSTQVVELHQQWNSQIRPVLLIAQAAVVLVLLIACANVASLLLARGAGRRHEMAIRAALGATRARLVRQLLGESLAMGLAGGLAGLVLANLLTAAFNTLPYTVLNRVEPFRLDAAAAALSLAAGLATGLLTGIVPALSIPGDPRRTRGAPFSALVAAEVALAVVLLGGAGLLARSGLHVSRLPRGLDPHRLLTAQIWLPPARYGEAARIARFWRDAIGRVAALPGVASASGVSFPPLSVLSDSVQVHIGSRPTPLPGNEPRVQYWVIGPDYFRTTGIPLLGGRDFTPQDDDESHGAAIVSTSLAARFWPGESPLGKRIRPLFPATDHYWLPKSRNLWLTVVGVAGDVRLDGIASAQLPQMYLPYAQSPTAILHLVVRTEGPPTRWSAAVRREILALDRDQPLFDVKPLDAVLDDSILRANTIARVLSSFALLATVLAAFGIHGVLAYAVARRTLEIGIRLAIGAAPAAVTRLVLRQMIVTVAAGIGFGIAGAVMAAPVYRTLLTGVAPGDPLTLAAIAALFAIVAVIAAWRPARRASRLDPVRALRVE